MTGDLINPPQTPETPATLLDRLGGQAALEACVAIFYVKNLTDVRIARFFEGVDVKRLERHQAVFLRHVFTNSAGRYTGASMEAAHARLIRDKGLNATHFDCVAENLVASLNELNVAQPLIDEVVDLVVPLRPLFPEPTEPAIADITTAVESLSVAEPSAAAATAGPSAAAAASDASEHAAAAADRESSNPAQEATLLERLGGEAALTACVKIFYEKNLSDERIIRFFEGVNIPRLMRHQNVFLRHVFTNALGRYTGATMQAAHARLISEKGLNATHFDCVAENLVASLNDLNVPQPLIDEVVALVVPLRPLFPEAVALPADPTPGDTPTLLERLGGDDALKACVEIFYTKNLVDPRIARFFEGVDVKRLERHQAVFLRHVFTNALSKYTGATMEAAHARLISEKGLNATHFDCVAENLVASLQELDVPAALIDEVVDLVVPLRPLFPEPAPAAVDACGCKDGAR